MMAGRLTMSGNESEEEYEEMVHIGGGTFTSRRNVEFMEIAIAHGLEPDQFPTLAAFIEAVEKLRNT